MGVDAKEKKIPIDFVVNFELPETYNQYKDFGSQGSMVINFIESKDDTQ